MKRVACRLALLTTMLVAIRVQPALGQTFEDLRSHVVSVRAHAAVALGRRGDPAAVPALVNALTDRESQVRREAARALGLIKDRRAVPQLIAALRDEDLNVRLYAAYALGEIRDPRAVEGLLQALTDSDWGMRDQAAWALRETKTPETRGALVATVAKADVDPAQLAWILRGFERRPVVDELCLLLKSPELVTRRRVTRVLRDLPDPGATGALLAALQDVDLEVRRLALESLVPSADERVVAALGEMVAAESNAELRSIAEAALQRLAKTADFAAHWSFDDGSVVTARDVTGRGTDGTIEACESAAGKVGLALRFREGSCVELGKPVALPTSGQPFTVMAWIRSEQDSGVVVARGGAFCGYSLYLKAGVAKFGIHCEQQGPTYLAAGTERLVGDWAHLAGVVREDRIDLFVNGKLVATTPTSGLLPSNCGQGMEIGFDRGNSPAEITDHFVGLIDEVKVFQAALSADSVVKQYRSAL